MPKYKHLTKQEVDDFLFKTPEGTSPSDYEQRLKDMDDAKGKKKDVVGTKDHATTASTSYTVRDGETLSEIAEYFGTTAQKIADQNGIKDLNKLKVGQKLNMKGFKQAAETKKK